MNERNSDLTEERLSHTHTHTEREREREGKMDSNWILQLLTTHCTQHGKITH